MKIRRLGVTALVTAGLLVASAAAGYGQVINTTNDGYSVDFTPDDGTAPVTAAEFPQVQAQRIADALSNTSTPAAGNPNGLHNGYAGLGFNAPDFAGSPRRVFVLDCAPVGGCDSSDAPADRIRMPAGQYRSQTEACLRGVVGHELFHHIQFGYMGGFGNWPTWGGDPVEGTARVMQDKLYTDLDNDSGCITYLSQVNSYLGSPDQTLWGRSYTTALFWNYLMEQLGSDRTEPHVGADFIRRFWENVDAAGSNRDFLATLRTTIHDFDNTKSLEQMFHDFTIANYTKQRDVSALPDGLRYRYVDEQGATPYDSVPVTDERSIPPTKGPKTASVARWAAKYVQADVGDCTGVAGVVVNGDPAGIGLVSQSSNAVTRLDKAVTSHFVRAVLVRTRANQNKRINRLGLVLTGLNDPANLTYTFACGAYDINIKNPRTATPAFVGAKNDPSRFVVRMQVQGPAELGTPSIEGLRAEDFTARSEASMLLSSTVPTSAASTG
jgi:hypothetical protein